MASEYTEGLGVELIGAGDKAGSWGDVTNNNLRALEEGLSRYAEIAVTAATADLDIPDASTAYSVDSKGRSSVIKWTGDPSNATHTVTLKVGGNPRAHARFTAVNSLSGTSNLVISCGAGTNVTIPNGYSAVIHIDGTNVVNSLANLSVDTLISSGTITGDLHGNATSVTNGVYTSNDLSALAPGATADELRTRVNGTTGTGNLVFQTNSTLNNPTLSNASFSGTAPAIDGTNITGTAANLTAGNATLAATATNATTAATVTTIPALTGAVTSSGSSNATTLANNAVLAVNIDLGAVTEPKLGVINTPTDGYILSAQSGGTMQWIAPGTAGNVTSVTGGDGITVANGTSASPSVAVDSTVVRTPGTVVRTSGIQTLSQKTLTAPSITSPTITSGPLTLENGGLIVNNVNDQISIEATDVKVGTGLGLAILKSLGAHSLALGTGSLFSPIVLLEDGLNADVSIYANGTGRVKTSSVSIQGNSKYLNFGSSEDSAGYGIRDAAGLIEVKNAAGAWGQPYHSNMVSGTGAYFETTGNSVLANSDGGPLPHLLGTPPRLITVKALCKVAQFGYTQGDTVYLFSGGGFNNRGISISADSTNIRWSIGAGGIQIIERDLTGTNGEQILASNTNWELQIMAWK